MEIENSNNEIKHENEEEPLDKSQKEEETEVLKEIDLSVIANPSISKAKRNSKQERKSEIMSKKLGEEEKKKPKTKLPSTLKEENKNRNNEVETKPNTKEVIAEDQNEEKMNKKKERHITLMQEQSNYDLASDLNSNVANISFAQLLDISPKLRAQLSKLLKLQEKPLNENIEEMVMSTVSKKDIATTKCKINGEEGFAFLDTCASINIITSKFLGKIKNIKPFGYTTNNIIQVTSKTNVSSELYHLTIEFNNFISYKDKVYKVCNELVVNFCGKNISQINCDKTGNEKTKYLTELTSIKEEDNKIEISGNISKGSIDKNDYNVI